MTCRRLCSWQRCTSTAAADVSTMALRSALPPSVTNRRMRCASRPRSIRSDCSSRTTRVASVEPSRSPHMLGSIGLDANSDEHDTVAEVNAVDHDYRQVQLAQPCDAASHPAALGSVPRIDARPRCSMWATNARSQAAHRPCSHSGAWTRLRRSLPSSPCSADRPTPPTGRWTEHPCPLRRPFQRDSFAASRCSTLTIDRTTSAIAPPTIAMSARLNAGPCHPRCWKTR